MKKIVSAFPLLPSRGSARFPLWAFILAFSLQPPASAQVQVIFPTVSLTGLPNNNSIQVIPDLGPASTGPEIYGNNLVHPGPQKLWPTNGVAVGSLLPWSYNILQDGWSRPVHIKVVATNTAQQVTWLLSPSVGWQIITNLNPPFTATNLAGPATNQVIALAEQYGGGSGGGWAPTNTDGTVAITTANGMTNISATGRFPGTVTASAVSVSIGYADATGTLPPATTIQTQTGSGAGLTGITASQISGVFQSNQIPSPLSVAITGGAGSAVTSSNIAGNALAQATNAASGYWNGQGVLTNNETGTVVFQGGVGFNGNNVNFNTTPLFSAGANIGGVVNQNGLGGSPTYFGNSVNASNFTDVFGSLPASTNILTKTGNGSGLTGITAVQAGAPTTNQLFAYDGGTILLHTNLTFTYGSNSYYLPSSQTACLKEIDGLFGSISSSLNIRLDANADYRIYTLGTVLTNRYKITGAGMNSSSFTYWGTTNASSAANVMTNMSRFSANQNVLTLTNCTMFVFSPWPGGSNNLLPSAFNNLVTEDVTFKTATNFPFIETAIAGIGFYATRTCWAGPDPVCTNADLNYWSYTQPAVIGCVCAVITPISLYDCQLWELADGFDNWGNNWFRCVSPICQDCGDGTAHNGTIYPATNAFSLGWTIHLENKVYQADIEDYSGYYDYSDVWDEHIAPGGVINVAIGGQGCPRGMLYDQSQSVWGYQDFTLVNPPGINVTAIGVTNNAYYFVTNSPYAPVFQILNPSGGQQLNGTAPYQLGYGIATNNQYFLPIFGNGGWYFWQGPAQGTDVDPTDLGSDGSAAFASGLITLQTNGTVTASNFVATGAGKFTGNGSGLTSLNASQLTGLIPTAAIPGGTNFLVSWIATNSAVLTTYATNALGGVTQFWATNQLPLLTLATVQANIPAAATNYFTPTNFSGTLSFGTVNATNLYAPGGITSGAIIATNGAIITGNGAGLTNAGTGIGLSLVNSNQMALAIAAGGGGSVAGALTNNNATATTFSNSLTVAQGFGINPTNTGTLSIQPAGTTSFSNLLTTFIASSGNSNTFGMVGITNGAVWASAPSAANFVGDNISFIGTSPGQFGGIALNSTYSGGGQSSVLFANNGVSDWEFGSEATVPGKPDFYIYNFIAGNFTFGIYTNGNTQIGGYSQSTPPTSQLVIGAKGTLYAPTNTASWYIPQTSTTTTITNNINNGKASGWATVVYQDATGGVPQITINEPGITTNPFVLPFGLDTTLRTNSIKFEIQPGFTNSYVDTSSGTGASITTVTWKIIQ